MTIVTAMVSPSARPSARITAPKMPARADGSTTRHVVSHHVAPRATAFSFRPRGTARMTSRETAVSVGRTQHPSPSDAVKKLPGGGPQGPLEEADRVPNRRPPGSKPPEPRPHRPPTP